MMAGITLDIVRGILRVPCIHQMRGTLQRITINALQCPTRLMYVRSIMQLNVNFFLINLNVV